VIALFFMFCIFHFFSRMGLRVISILHHCTNPIQRLFLERASMHQAEVENWRFLSEKKNKAISKPVRDGIR